MENPYLGIQLILILFVIAVVFLLIMYFVRRREPLSELKKMSRKDIVEAIEYLQQMQLEPLDDDTVEDIQRYRYLEELAVKHLTSLS